MRQRKGKHPTGKGAKARERNKREKDSLESPPVPAGNDALTNAIAIAVIVGCLTACLFRLTSLNTQNIIYVRGESDPVTVPYLKHQDTSYLGELRTLIWDELKVNVPVHVMQPQFDAEEPPAGRGFFHDVAAKQLEAYVHGVKKSDFMRAFAKAPQGKGRKFEGAVWYQIRQHLLFRQPFCFHARRCKGFEKMLLDLAPEMGDLDIALNVKDWPTSYEDEAAFPLLSTSKVHGKHGDMLVPTWAFREGGPAVALRAAQSSTLKSDSQSFDDVFSWDWDAARRVMLQSSKAYPWPLKVEHAFFRGSHENSVNRDAFYHMARTNPSLFDVEYTSNGHEGIDNKMKEKGIRPVELVSLADHCKYKYLLSFDGKAASNRLRHAMLCGSLVFHFNGAWSEFWMDKLVPWVHFVPFTCQDEDGNIAGERCEELLSFFKRHDDLAQKIAENGQNFIKRYLTSDNVQGYWKDLLGQYVQMMDWVPEEQDGFLHIEPEPGDF